MENAEVASLVLEMWPHVEQYATAVKTRQLPQPKTKSWAMIAQCCDDSLFVVKANIFLTFAKDVTPFLTKYQTDQPMLLFLSSDLVRLICDLLARFVKKEVLSPIKGPVKLLQQAIHDRTNHVDTSAIDIGFAADRALCELKRNKKISDREAFSVRQDAKKCLVTMVDNLLEKSPLRQGLAVI